MSGDDEAEILVDDPPLCSRCNGSGEGMHEGTRCWECKGSGVERAREDE